MKKPKITLLAGALCVLVFSFALTASAETPAAPAPDTAAAETTDTETGDTTEINEAVPAAPTPDSITAQTAETDTGNAGMTGEAVSATPAYYPYEITTQDDAGETLLLKKYRVPEGTDVSALIEQNLTWLGQPYKLWGVTAVTEGSAVERQGADRKYEMYVHTNDPDAARGEVKESIEYDADGFTGTLALADLTCAAEQQADGTYLAYAHYTGTVTRTQPGSTEYTLYYAPVYTDAAVDGMPVAEIDLPVQMILYSLGVLVVLLALVLIITLVQHRRGKKEAQPVAAPVREPKPRPTVYVPSGDIVPGSDKEDDLDDEL